MSNQMAVVATSRGSLIRRAAGQAIGHPVTDRVGRPAVPPPPSPLPLPIALSLLVSFEQEVSTGFAFVYVSKYTHEETRSSLRNFLTLRKPRSTSLGRKVNARLVFDMDLSIDTSIAHQ